MEANLRISQQSLEMDDIISELNSKGPNMQKPKIDSNHDDMYMASPRNPHGDDTFDHIDENQINSHRASCESLTREFSPSHVNRTEIEHKEEVHFSHQTAYGVSKERFFKKQEQSYHHPQLIDEDVETFKAKLEASILSFKTEALKDFMSIKRNVLQEQSSTIDTERNKYNALLNSKQNEIETLKEELASANKLNDDLRIRSEILALMAGKNKSMMRLKVVQYKAFKALKDYAGFKKYSKNILQAKERENKLKMKRRVFQGWGKHWKEWKIQKDKDDFQAKLKQEMSSISAQYSKEIDSLRHQLNEAKNTIEVHEKTKMMTQENLKKAFMKGVCAMNMEAMTILNPSEQSNIERKFDALADGIFSDSTPVRQLPFNNITDSNYRAYDSSLKGDEIFKRFGMNLSENTDSDNDAKNYSIHETPPAMIRNDAQGDMSTAEKEIKVERNAYTDFETASMTKGYQNTSNVKIFKPGDDIIINNTKIQSKDNAWKPAPVMSEPVIINNVSKFSNAPSKPISYSQNIPLPKHTLGSGQADNYKFLSSYQQLSSTMNADLHDLSPPVPLSYPLASENPNSKPSQSYTVIKENINSNIIESLPKSSLPSFSTTTTSATGKTIRLTTNTT